MLIGASTHGTPTEVKLALKLGADPNLRVQTELTPLMFAAGYTSNPEVINALVEYGADPKMKNDSGWQAIDLAEENECIREQRSIIN
jgi:ankyrin repeat protein